MRRKSLVQPSLHAQLGPPHARYSQQADGAWAVLDNVQLGSREQRTRARFDFHHDPSRIAGSDRHRTLDKPDSQERSIRRVSSEGAIRAVTGHDNVQPASCIGGKKSHDRLDEVRHGYYPSYSVHRTSVMRMNEIAHSDSATNTAVRTVRSLVTK